MLNWQKLQNEISEINADDINKLADAIIDNQNDIEELKKTGSSVDLSNYYTKAEIDGKIDSIDVDLSGYYTKEQTDDLISDVWTNGFYALESRINDLENSYGVINTHLDEIIALQVAKGGDAE